MIFCGLISPEGSGKDNFSDPVRLEKSSASNFILTVLFLTSAVTSFSVSPKGADTSTSSPFSFSVSHRIRAVGWDNAVTLNEKVGEDTFFTRHRTSLSTSYKPSDELKFTLKLTNEFRYYLLPPEKDYTLNEIFVDNLYVRWNRPAELPFTLTLGRQNMMLGEGFVVMDGHPLDGSRSIYFDAVRADVFLSNDQKLTLFYTDQPATDTRLPVLNDQEQALVEQPESGLGLYYSGKRAGVTLDAYLIRKWVDMLPTLPCESEIDTFGGRVAAHLTGDITAVTEWAVQRGKYGDVNRKAFGGYGTLSWATGWNDALPRILNVGVIFLSGDKVGTETWEGWDPVFSRWPKWSESYIYTLIPEHGGRVAYWSNVTSLTVGATFRLCSYADLDLTYHRLGAHREDPREDSFPGGTGRTRGDLWITKISFKLTKTLTGHFLWERFDPGDFYFNSADGYHWLRMELMVKF